MVKQDASARIALSSLHDLVRDIAAFIVHPRLPAERMQWSRLMVFLLVAVVTIDLTIDTAAQFLLDHVDEVLVDLPEPQDFDYNLVGDILSLLILAPIVEEALFRGWLSGHKASLRFAGWGAVAYALVLVSESPLLADFYMVPVALAIGVAGLAMGQWAYTHKRDNQVPRWFEDNFHWFAWGSSLAFGALHLVNYDHLDSPIDAIIVAPVALGGLLLAYSRTRFGLRAAMVHHAAYNLVYVIAFNLPALL